MSLTRILAAGFWLFCVRKQRPVIWKEFSGTGYRVTRPNSQWGICAWRWDFRCPRGKREDKFYSAAYKECVCIHTYARVHKVLRFVKDLLHIWHSFVFKVKAYMNIMLMERAAGGGWTWSLSPQGSTVYTSPSCPCPSLGSLQLWLYLTELTKQLRAEQQEEHGHTDDSTSNCSCWSW